MVEWKDIDEEEEADELEEDEEGMKKKEDFGAGVEVEEKEGRGELGEAAEEMEELETMEEEERTGDIVEEEGKEKVEPIIDWKEVKRDEEEADKGTGENMAVGDE